MGHLEFPRQWIHGSDDCDQNQDPLIQVHEAAPGTFILRQNMCVHYEAPFMYLLFGEDKVFLQDTGAVSEPDQFPLRETIDQLIASWLTRMNRKSIELIITHSHGHGDHVAADEQFADRPNTIIVPPGESSVSSFFRITNWPNQVVQFELGNRQLDIIPIPGHLGDHIAVFDKQTGALFTGDTLYPGNLYIRDWQAYTASIHRLASYGDTRDIEYVLGTHIEMTNIPGVRFELGSTYHPNEHPLELHFQHLQELHRALTTMGNNPQEEVHDDFVIVPF